jgi:adenosylmethionine-8-amino-7-oxononanoate aminotransferase
VIEEENLLDNIREQGAYLGKLLHERLSGPNALAAPFTFDVRGAGGFWGIEFDFDQPAAASLDLKSERFALAVQAKALQNGLVIMGFYGGGSLDGVKGDHNVIAPAYNTTKEEVEIIVDLYVKSVEDVLREAGAK